MRITLGLNTKFLITIGIVITITLCTAFHSLSKRQEMQILAQVKKQARILFEQIVITRKWVASHGGGLIYVEKTPYIKSNPYLPDPDIIDRTGKIYTKRNPALVTRELSAYASKEGLYWFHITSLKLLNPDNAPDDFEREALTAFEKHSQMEFFRIEGTEGKKVFRYMAPLYIEKECLQCHTGQGYKVGDVRGGISVFLPMDDAEIAIRSNTTMMEITGGLTIFFVSLVLMFLIRFFVVKPIGKLKKDAVKIGRGLYETSTPLKTGDEIEELSTAFYEMAGKLKEYHTTLEDKVRIATKDLAEVNKKLIEANRRLEELDKRKSAFMADISHELRTPLTSIKGAMDYLSVRFAMHKKDNEEDLRVFFEVIKKNAERLIRLVNNVLDYERIELGELEMHFKEINLKDVFDEVITGFRSLSEGKKVNIELRGEAVTVYADEDRIKQVLTNLLSNALNFSPESSDIIVTLTGMDGYANASVEDSGCGIAEAEKEMVFRQFYSKGVKDGTGLGLAICKGIIEAHNGEIGLKTAEGKGSHFWFTIPKTRKEAFLNEKTPACSR